MSTHQSKRRPRKLVSYGLHLRKQDLVGSLRRCGLDLAHQSIVSSAHRPRRGEWDVHDALETVHEPRTREAAK